MHYILSNLLMSEHTQSGREAQVHLQITTVIQLVQAEVKNERKKYIYIYTPITTLYDELNLWMC